MIFFLVKDSKEEIMTNILHSVSHNQEARVITKALSRASDYWELSNKQLGEIIGLSEATISRLKDGKYFLKIDSKQWQLALIFLRIFRGLDAYMGGHAENEKAWLNANNKAFNASPIKLMKNVEGLASLVQYVDYVRGQ